MVLDHYPVLLFQTVPDNSGTIESTDIAHLSYTQESKLKVHVVKCMYIVDLNNGHNVMSKKDSSLYGLWYFGTQMEVIVPLSHYGVSFKRSTHYTLYIVHQLHIVTYLLKT